MAKRKFRRRTFKKKRKARKVATVGTVKRMISRTIEHKWVGKSLPLDSGYTLPVPGLLNGLILGTGSDQRLGDKVKFLSMDLKVNMVAGAVALANRVRMIVFSDKQANQAQFLSTSVFAGGVLSATSVFQPRHPDFWPMRYRVHLDKTFYLTQQGGATNIPQEMIRTFKVKLNLTSQYQQSATAGTIADIIKNALWIIFVSDETVAQQPTTQYWATLRYIDA